MDALKNSTWKDLLQKYEYWHKCSLKWNMQLQAPEEAGQSVKKSLYCLYWDHTKAVTVSHLLFLSSLSHEENK